MSMRRVFAAVTLAVTAGCSSLQPVPVEFITEATPLVVRISDGYRTVEVANPRLSGDTVLGTARGAHVAIPLRQVQQVATVRFSRGRTALFASGLAIIGGLTAYAFLTRDNGRSNFVCDYNEPTEDHEREKCDFIP